MLQLRLLDRSCVAVDRDVAAGFVSKLSDGGNSFVRRARCPADHHAVAPMGKDRVDIHAWILRVFFATCNNQCRRAGGEREAVVDPTRSTASRGDRKPDDNPRQGSHPFQTSLHVGRRFLLGADQACLPGPAVVLGARIVHNCKQISPHTFRAVNASVKR